MKNRLTTYFINNVGLYSTLKLKEYFMESEKGFISAIKETRHGLLVLAIAAEKEALKEAEKAQPSEQQSPLEKFPGRDLLDAMDEYKKGMSR